MKFDFLSESDQAYFIHKASTLVEALPFIREHSGDTIVIKYGGHAMGDPKLAKSFARDIGLIKEVGIFPVVIHGGGPQMADKLKTINISSKFVDGLRVSNKDVVKIAEEVFIEFNKEILNEIKNYSVNAKSITSKENNIINVKAISEELGFVGKPCKIDTDILKKIFKEGELPIIAPLGLDSENQVYNVNADDIATFVASSLNARRLIMISDVAGVLDKDNNLISEINSAKAAEMIASGEITQGMVVKINNAINVANKVKGTVIIDGRVAHSILYELLSDKGSGTLIRA